MCEISGSGRAEATTVASVLARDSLRYVMFYLLNLTKDLDVYPKWVGSVALL